MPARVKKTTGLDDIGPEMARIFEQVQTSTANHQKNCVALHKIHIAAREITEETSEGFTLVGQKAFQEEFLSMVLRALPVKKGLSPADRVLKFVGAYVSFCTRQAEDSGDLEHEHNYADSLVKRLHKSLLKGFSSKDKIVRYRSIQALAEVISGLGELDDDLYESIRKALMSRTKDKETSVRVQAVIALSKLAGADNEDDVSDEEDSEERTTAMGRIIERMHKDPSADVRRAAMANLPVMEATLDEHLKRSRDVDTITRKMVYTHCLANNITQPSEDGQTVFGPTHPKVLNIEQRELVANNGLGDRDTSVRTAAATLIGKWLDCLTLEDSPIKKEDAESKEGHSENILKLTALLSLFILQDDSKVARDVLIAMFESRPEVFESLEFNEKYWRTLNPETVFLVRVYVDHCIVLQDQARLEEALPVVTALAFRIQETHNALMESLQNDVEQEIDDSLLDEQFAKEFIIGEMLRIATNLDYSDEMGRRKMYDLTRDMLGSLLLPEGLVPGCLDVMRKISSDEGDMLRVVVEMVQDLRDPQGDDENADKDMDDEDEEEDEEAAARKPKKPRSSLFHKPMDELTPEEQAESDRVDMRCLILCIHMMERVMGTLEEHGTMDGVIQELIIPCVQRKDPMFRMKGLHALGLVNLIARTMARQSIGLFIKQVEDAPPEMQCMSLKAIFDTVMMHNGEFLAIEDNRNWFKKYFIDLLVNMENPLEPEVQALICAGLSKLSLSGMLVDDDIILLLWEAYIDPSTRTNLPLRQNLAYFFQAFSMSSNAAQRQLCRVFPNIFKALQAIRDDTDEDARMSSATQIIGLFSDWTDPIHVKSEGIREDVDEELHIEFASTVIRVLLDPDDDYAEYLIKEDKKALCSALNKLSLPDEVDDLKIKTLKVLVNGLRTKKALPDTVSKNAVKKFDELLTKKYEAQLSDFTEEDWSKLEELNEAFKVVDLAGENEDVEEPPKRKGRKRRSESMVTDSEADDQGSARPTNATKSKSKRRRVSETDDEDYEGAEDLVPKSRPRIGKGTKKPPTAPKRTVPKRSAAAAAKKKVGVIEILSSAEEEEEEDEEEDEDATPAPDTRKSRRGKRSRTTQETDEEMEDVEETPRPGRRRAKVDDESEDEVNDLLADE